ncbi:MAG: succinate dehydrogenase cytochrome b subunit [Solirubrobacterales bacterium]
MKLATLLGSTIGKKVVMAVTGIVLLGFVVGHMIGNLLIYLGPHAINEYGLFLREFLHGGAIWIVRGGLLAAVALHIWAAVSLTLENRAARPVGYRRQHRIESTYASRTMVWSGPILALFIAFHLADLTFGAVTPGFVHGDVYNNLILTFSRVPASAFYILAMLALGLHLYHGIWSGLQTLGANHPRWNALRNRIAAVVAAVVMVGNISIPLAVLAKVVKPRPATSDVSGLPEGKRQRTARGAGLTPAERAGEVEGARHSAPSLNR